MKCQVPRIATAVSKAVCIRRDFQYHRYRPEPDWDTTRSHILMNPKPSDDPRQPSSPERPGLAEEAPAEALRPPPGRSAALSLPAVDHPDRDTDAKHVEGPSRVVSLDAGTAMVVTDLHGDWDAYRRYRDHFLALRADALADYLIFTGDLIHSEGPPEADRSLDILLDLLVLREAFGERLIYLLGNHELPHLYGVILTKGERVYTPHFEAALGVYRKAILKLFDRLPLYVRTQAGVSVCHAGAAAELSAPGAAARVFNYSHQAVRAELEALLPVDQRPALRERYGQSVGIDYHDLARYYLAASGPDHPRYDDLLVGYLASSHPEFELLWATLFNRNEQQYGEADYAIFLDALLAELSADYHRQEVLVTGHVPCRGGYKIVAGHQLRIASGAHAHPHRSGRYLCFDVAAPVREAEELLGGLGSVFES